MATFSILSKTYAKDKLSKCATTVLLVCCYLYRKRSNEINVNAEAKCKVELWKLPSMTLVFLPRYQEASKLLPSPCWSPLQGIPRKGQAPGQVTPWIALDLFHIQVGLQCAFRQVSPRLLPTVFTIKLPPKHCGPCSLRYTVAATPQMRLM